MPKRVIAGKVACKHPNGRGKHYREFTIGGVGYCFCYGWNDDFGDGTAPQCEDCPAHINAADGVSNQLIANRRTTDENC